MASKTSAVGRLVTLSAVGGVLAAAMVLPVVAATGILIRNTADKFSPGGVPSTSGLPQRSEILDRDGHLITYVYGVDLGPGMSYSGIDRAPVAYDQISSNMVNAIIAIEDSRYWSHGAIDLKGTLRALINDIEHKPIQGGSTIAQQYVKDVLILEAGNNQQEAEAAQALTLSRKLQQLRMAVATEHQMSKKQILDGYLNDAYYGSGAWGIEAAAETYFSTTASSLTLPQSALLAGIVEDPSRYDPLLNSSQGLERRNTVLARMEQTGMISTSVLDKAMNTGLGLNQAAPQSGCMAPGVGDDAFFCDYVEHVVLLDPSFGSTTQERAELLATGGLRIYTTLNPRDQNSATNAVNYVVPPGSGYYNPGNNAATEVVIQPGTGQVEAIAEDRPYGTGTGQTEVDYAVQTAYGGSGGVQTGSSSKLFTLVTALEQGVPFGYTETVGYSATDSGYTNCAGGPAGYDSQTQQTGAWSLVNSSNSDRGTFSLYTGTTQSINTFFAQLELKVGLCNVVHTAMNMGMTWANGASLLKPDFGESSADNTPSFTLGSLNVTPMQMAAAYATVAAQGKYCSPIVLMSVTTDTNKSVPVPPAGCRQAIPQTVANAANYILQGVLTGSGTAAAVGGFPGREAAGKTGTSNVGNGNGTPYASFAGYTPTMTSYTSVFNPISPTQDTMGGQNSCYRLEFGGLDCPGEMYGANAPASAWHMTFDHASLGPAENFVPVPRSSPLWRRGNGQSVVQAPAPGTGGHAPHHPRPGQGGGGFITPPPEPTPPGRHH